MEEQIHAPRIGELPDSKVLNRAAFIAATVAAVLLVTIVLPAEFGIDKTGVGRLLNLTEMGQVKRAAAEAEAAARKAELESWKFLPNQSGQQVISLAPGEGREVKAKMA